MSVVASDNAITCIWAPLSTQCECIASTVALSRCNCNVNGCGRHSKADAQAQGREMAADRGVEHVIKKQDGTIGEKNTYPRSRDPRDIEG
ncbi:DUF2188 domain-containing protein [Micromonospora sp. ALFpr18c]|uniref:DUF2188 domain-containing protein n=1 Tax=unclassified Micromonospora TaxID=2617518 RepID=UPI001CED0F4B|nr:DUF2188 domain-containing protein [Micromonospora sp. ALFpr18c]